MKLLSDEDLQQLTIQVAQGLLNRGWLLATAESCTGGWVAKCCTDLSGSSAWFYGGFITYSNQAKHTMINVNEKTLAFSGAVSEQTVIEMAQGALQNSSANISVSISGIAGPAGGCDEKHYYEDDIIKLIGPAGGCDEKPVGTVWLAWATEKSAKAELHHFSGNRDAVRRQAVVIALKGIIKNVMA